MFLLGFLFFFIDLHRLTAEFRLLTAEFRQFTAEFRRSVVVSIVNIMCITLSVIVDCNEGTELTHFLTWLKILRGVINTIYEKAFKLGASYLFKQLLKSFMIYLKKTNV